VLSYHVDNAIGSFFEFEFFKRDVVSHERDCFWECCESCGGFDGDPLVVLRTEGAGVDLVGF